MPDFIHETMFPLAKADTPWRKLTGDYVKTAEFGGAPVLSIDGAALTELSRVAFFDIAHYLRTSHLAQLANIMEDPEASDNDRFVTYELLKNANISAGGILPMCQDTGTAIIMGKKGHRVMTRGDDEARLAEGVFRTYAEDNLRYSQLAPLSMYDEVNTGSNLPAQIEIYATEGEAYDFLFIAKGGGSANKSYLYQETKALLNPDSLMRFVDEKIRTLGTAACPPYHLVIVIGGTSAELTLKTVKLASCHYLDGLPEAGSDSGHAFRDRALEEDVLKLTQRTGIGAQFGGKYFC
ncbi:MAG: fumarate hydratase, partial [Alphaproteobacteria bacterium]